MDKQNALYHLPEQIQPLAGKITLYIYVKILLCEFVH